jgi:hypothetical protein
MIPEKRGTRLYLHFRNSAPERGQPTISEFELAGKRDVLDPSAGKENLAPPALTRDPEAFGFTTRP